MGRPTKICISLKPKEVKTIQDLQRGGVHFARTIQRGRTLLLLSEGLTPPRVGQLIGLSAPAVRNIRQRYCEGGLERALYDAPRPGAEPALDESQRQRIIAMVRGDPPEGRGRWTVRLITQEAVKRRLIHQIGRETIRLLLLHHDLKPWREKNVVRRRD
jgi:putative transposase